MEKVDIMHSLLVSGEISMGDYKTIMDRRLSQNFISQNEYVKLLKDIKIDPNEFEPSQNNKIYSRDVIASIDDKLIVYSTHMQYLGENIDFESVRNVRGVQYSETMNFVPVGKISWIHVDLDNNTSISFREERALLGLKRHNSIHKALSVLSNMTFDIRKIKFYDKLDWNQYVKLRDNMSHNISEIIFHANGNILGEGKCINIKKCHENGVIGFGTTGSNIFGRQVTNTPTEIVLSEEKGFFKKSIPKNNITFVPLTEDVDVVCSVIAWYADSF